MKTYIRTVQSSDILHNYSLKSRLIVAEYLPSRDYFSVNILINVLF